MDDRTSIGTEGLRSPLPPSPAAPCMLVYPRVRGTFRMDSVPIRLAGSHLCDVI